MGFIAPAAPPVDIEERKRKPHLSRIKPLAQDWAINGFGTPGAVSPPGRSSTWRSTRACSPRRVPARCPSGDAVPGTGGRAPGPGGDRRPARLPRAARPARQGRPSCAARPEMYGLLLLVFLFPLGNMIVASQLVFFCIWLGRGLVQAQPALPVRRLGDDQQHAVEPVASGQGRLYRGLPEDLRPVAAWRPSPAHLGTAIEFTLPLVLLVLPRRDGRHDRRDGDDPLPCPHHLDVPARRAARVEPVHDLQAPVPVRALRVVPFSTLDDPLLIALLVLCRRAHPGRSATSGRTRSRSCRRCATTPATGPRASGCFARTVAPRRSSTARSGKPAPVVVEQLAQRLRSRDRPSCSLDQGLGLPLDALARPGAQRAAAARRRRRRGLPRARGRARGRGRRSAGTSATATSTTSSCSRAVQERCGFAEASCGSSSLEAQPAHVATPALPDLRRRDRPDRGGLDRTSPTWSSGSVAGRVLGVPGATSPSARRAAGSSVERSGRRRLGAQRARMRGRARPRGRRGDRARGGGLDRRRDAHERADAPRPAARPLLGRASDGGGLAVPELARARRARAAVALARGRPRPPARRWRRGHARALARRHRARTRRRRPRLAAAVRGPGERASTPSTRISCVPCSTSRATRSSSRGSACPRRCRRRCSPGSGPSRGPAPCSAVSPPIRSLRCTRPMSAAVGMALTTACHRYGWPVARGGSRAITDALAAVLLAHGGRIETGARVRSLAELPRVDVVVFDLAPGAVADIAADRLPARVARAYRRYRRGPGAFKLDLAVEGGVPWTDEACRRAGTVHAIGSFEEIVAAEREVNRGRMPERPFVLVGQQYLADPERSRGDVHPVWSLRARAARVHGRRRAGAHRPDRALRPGAARAHRRPRVALAGTAAGRQRELRRRRHHHRREHAAAGRSSAHGWPLIRTPPASRGCSSARRPPRRAPGAHGMNGYNAARSALAHLRAHG